MKYPFQSWLFWSGVLLICTLVFGSMLFPLMAYANDLGFVLPSLPSNGESMDQVLWNLLVNNKLLIMWMAINAVSTQIPPPTKKSSILYKIFYKFLNNLAFNVGRARNAGDPTVKKAKSKSVKPSTAQ